MFVQKKNNNYFWPIKMKVPASGGKYEDAHFDAEFKLIPQSRIKQIFKDVSSDDAKIHDVDVVKEVLIGWKGILDEEGKEIPFSLTKLEELVEIPSFASEVVAAFFDSIAGAKRKN